jgi:very-short-patch-repair endonuclease
MTDKPKNINLAQQLRRKQTDAENKLWMHLKNRRLSGVKFRRQHPIGNYIVDFVCLELKLIIEIDGHHNEEQFIEKDLQRQNWLESAGFQLIRFWNNDVLENIEGVIFKIQEYLNNNTLI